MVYTREMKGVCSVCQDIQKVKMIGYQYKELDFFDDERFLNEWIMSEHNFKNTNIYCEGSGTTPEVLINNELNNKQQIKKDIDEKYMNETYKGDYK